MKLIFLMNVVKFKLRRRLCRYRATIDQRRTLRAKYSKTFLHSAVQSAFTERASEILKRFLFHTDLVRSILWQTLDFFKRINFIVREYKVHHECMLNRFNGLIDVIWVNCSNSLNTYFTEKYKGRKLP